MATVLSTELSLTTPNKLASREFHGVKHVAHFNKTLTAAVTASDVLELLDLPPNSVVYGDESYFAHDTVMSGASPTFDMGWQAYTDNTGASVAANAAGLISNGSGSAGKVALTALSNNVAQVKKFNNRTPVRLQVKPDTGFTFQSGDTIFGYITYSND